MNWREEKAFSKGMVAAKMGRSIVANPYTFETPIQSANFWAWKHGFESAMETMDVRHPSDHSKGV